jgi:hypothetical protein
MSRLVFWDASAFIALGNRNDILHPQAKDLSHQLAKERTRLFTTNAVLTEVGNGFSKIGLRSIAERLIESTIQSTQSGAAEIVHVSEGLWQRGWQLFQERPDKEWGLTDCISFIVMHDHNITEAFTADKHFEQAGYVRLLKQKFDSRRD